MLLQLKQLYFFFFLQSTIKLICFSEVTVYTLPH